MNIKKRLAQQKWVKKVKKEAALCLLRCEKNKRNFIRDIPRKLGWFYPKQNKEGEGQVQEKNAKKVFKRDNYTCQQCNKRGTFLQVDHIKPWSKYKNLRFDINNCRTLCIECHYQLTYGKPMPKKVKVWGHNLSLILERKL